jgi:hypothetical protein
MEYQPPDLEPAVVSSAQPVEPEPPTKVRSGAKRALAEVLTADSVATAIRRELWRQRQHRIENDEVVKLLRETVLRPECFE